MTPKIYINGKFFDKPDAKISVYDHGFLYGDGVFEGVRIYDGKIFKLKEHVDRLYESARAIRLEVPLTKAQMTEAIKNTVAVNEKKNGYIRPIITRGVGGLGIDPRKCADGQVVIIVDDITLYPPELYETGMEIATVATVRNHPAALSPRIKSLNYLNNIMAKMEGNLAGCPEALMLNHKGEISECSADNFFLVKDGELKTPPLDAGVLEGVTRNTVLDLAREAGIPAREVTLTRHDVFISEECFLTGTGAEIIPVIKCDGRLIGSGKPGPITRQLREAYQHLTRQ